METVTCVPPETGVDVIVTPFWPFTAVVQFTRSEEYSTVQVTVPGFETVVKVKRTAPL